VGATSPPYPTDGGSGVSAGFNFRGQIFWGTNGSIEVYLEALAHQAAARLGAADPLVEFLRREREGWFNGTVVLLDQVLIDRETCDWFVLLFDAATEQLLREDAFTDHGRAWIEGTLGPLRQRIMEAAQVG
jgi:hypothetical protein